MREVEGRGHFILLNDLTHSGTSDRVYLSEALWITGVPLTGLATSPRSHRTE